MNVRTTLALAMLAILAPACKTAMAVKGQHKASLEALSKVSRGEEFAFTVILTDASGQRADDVSYQWKVDWVGLPGMMHKGKSGVPTKIRVKGQPGKGTLTIFALEGEMPAEIARHEFTVE